MVLPVSDLCHVLFCLFQISVIFCFACFRSLSYFVLPVSDLCDVLFCLFQITVIYCLACFRSLALSSPAAWRGRSRRPRTFYERVRHGGGMAGVSVLCHASLTAGLCEGGGQG